MYLKLVLYGIVLLLFFRAVSFAVKRLSFQPALLRTLTLMLPVAELLAWLGFLVWGIREITETESNAVLYAFAAAGAVVLVAAWFLIREFIYGLSLVIQGKLETGAPVKIEQLTGKITRIGHFSFDLITDDGSIETIPYSRVKSEIISRPGQNVHLEKAYIRFAAPVNQNIEQVTEGLKKTLLNAPWVAASQQPIIKNISTGENAHVFEVVVYLPEKALAGKVKAYVERNFINGIGS